jgi:hypothetical protein
MSSTEGFAYRGVYEKNYSKWNRRRIRNYGAFSDGDKIIYCRCPRPSNEAAAMPMSNVDAVPLALIEYDGRVIQKTPFHITIEITPREGQIAGYSKPIPYKVSIARADIGDTELLSKVEEA